ncbi:hypothetical protein [Paraliobacillus ryukyuensis]|uniref:hypothetical protein n=1 Tax=Paraliobacillus ryukyuensis TaxID=200904 RepID=UPI00117E050A|nr:hypothetical protein [Paraliobacillus ryukyuensis]
MKELTKKIIPYMAYYILAGIACLGFLFHLWTGIILLDDPNTITDGQLLGTFGISSIIITLFVFLANRKEGYCLGLTALSLLMFILGISMIVDLPPLTEWQRADMFALILTTTSFLALFINGQKMVRKLVQSQNIK